MRRSWVSSLTIFLRPRSARSRRTAGLMQVALIFLLRPTLQYSAHDTSVGVGVASAVRPCTVETNAGQQDSQIIDYWATR